MTDPFTVSGIASSMASHAIAKTSASFIDKISPKIIKDKYDELRLLLDKGLPTYLEANYAKCSTIKTLLNRNDPVSLSDCFVAPDFLVKRKTMDSDKFLKYINRNGTKAIVTGLAGSGKSVFLKYAFTRSIEFGFTYYPVFLELRLLNRSTASEGLLLREVYKSIQSACSSFTEAQFNFGLERGAFYFIFDGFDEVNLDLRDQIAREINDLARNYFKCAVIVSSRPSDEFISWDGFLEANLLAFDLDKVTTYIDKIPFDNEKKSEFLADLKDGLFDKNEEFLSNPLLAAMMLLTYDSFGEIPEKRHIFYSKCFDVLTREHDSSKGRYKRDLHCDASMDQLELMFMYFCAFSYVDRIFSFNDTQMHEYVGRAISASANELDINDVISDFRESISIIERVGLLYEFAHRSFQEYFYAKFVVTDRRMSLEEKIGLIRASFVTENTIEMIADMDRVYFEDDFLLPSIKRFCDAFEDIDPEKDPAGILSVFFSEVASEDKDGSGVDSTSYLVTSQKAALGRSLYFYRAARKNAPIAPDEMVTSIDNSKITAEIVKKKFGGSLKINATNNKKLIEASLDALASRTKRDFGLLLNDLVKRQEARQKGLGNLIKRNYS